VRALRAIAAVVVIVVFAGASPDDLSVTLRATAAEYYANAGSVAAVTSRDTAKD
jgi:hypothetical protein